MSAIANQIVIEPTDLDSENEYLDVEYLKEEWITPDGYDGEHQSNSDEEISMKNNSEYADAGDKLLYKLFPCKFCKINFSANEVNHLATQTQHQQYNPLISVETKHEINIFKCDKCARKLCSKNAVKVHTAKNRSIEKSKNCNICGKSFTYYSQMMLHMNIHGENLFICDICGHGCKSKGLLKRHINSHSNEKKFECNICGIKVKYKAGLNCHMRKHTGEKPYSCEICKKSYAHCSDLRRHRTTHGIFKQEFKCSVCLKIFYEAKFLRQHMKVHT